MPGLGPAALGFLGSLTHIILGSGNKGKGDETASAINPPPDWNRRRLPELPSLPVLPTLPAISSVAMPISGPSLAPSVPMARSSATIPTDRIHIACAACTRSHLSTMAGATDDLLAGGPESRLALARIAAEATALRQYDLSPDRLARTPAGDRAIVDPVVGEIDALLASMPKAPDPLLLAWASADEAARLARDMKDPVNDPRQVQERMDVAEAKMSYSERELLAPGRIHPDQRDSARMAARHLRDARHILSDNTPGDSSALEQIAAHLQAAAVLMTPEPTPRQAQAVAHQVNTTKGAFQDRLLTAMAARNRKGPAKSTASLDVDRRIRAELKGALLAKENVSIPFDGLLGATPQTAQYFLRLAQFNKDRGVRVRIENLPATWDAVLNGLYDPDTNMEELAPKVLAEDNQALQTFAHETIHSLLHNHHCLPHRTPTEEYHENYENTVEETEAELGTALTFALVHLPLEFSDGDTIPADELQADVPELKKVVDPETYQRAAWAAKVMAMAMQGKEGPALAEAPACPVRK